MINYSQCIGCGRCVVACPYKARTLRWEKICGPNWRKVVYVLNRGGRFQEYKDVYKGEHVANQYGKLLNIYQEKTAETRYA
ncbi:MAG: 4Fe-4S binding protein, partial [Deltaproteobacteria bacterium]|nr:4Fe-4S binding protein [Deltaproteobacteria bacterium]